MKAALRGQTHRRSRPGDFDAGRSRWGFEMVRTFLALAIAASVAGQPAFAFGPAALGRDLMYTSAIGHAPETPLTTGAGFVRPNAPFAVQSPAGVEGESYEMRSYSRHLTVVVDFVFDRVVSEAAGTLAPFLR
jgi:hypothetical protein